MGLLPVVGAAMMAGILPYCCDTPCSGRRGSRFKAVCQDELGTGRATCSLPSVAGPNKRKGHCSSLDRVILWSLCRSGVWFDRGGDDQFFFSDWHAGAGEDRQVNGPVDGVTSFPDI